MLPLSPFRIFPGIALKRSQMLSPRPSSSVAPSIWYAETAAPHTNLPETRSVCHGHGVPSNL